MFNRKVDERLTHDFRSTVLRRGPDHEDFSILEVDDKGSKEDLSVRVSIILPFVTRVDIVAEDRLLKQIQELLERVADPKIVKSRVRFYSFKDFLS